MPLGQPLVCVNASLGEQAGLIGAEQSVLVARAVIDKRRLYNVSYQISCKRTLAADQTGGDG
ncbi:hypothetical protein G3578_12205 [Brevibacillus sp. SYP-B805]|uniref:hypothetical protein n=1 Tax=Brevibacillus sp. SYP-B805 TaxID=1578199 RepID=UPI0013EA2C0D|nr:hypothetical protein [Brevibacillus sp. SYP-B805]NGQ95919.1 hypothetical protein [Brevibacillus sp. SYP-B805]